MEQQVKTLKACDGIIVNGRCNKCFDRPMTSSLACGRMYEFEDKKEKKLYTTNMEEREINALINGHFEDIRAHVMRLYKEGKISAEDVYYIYCKLSSVTDEESLKFIQ